MGTLMPLSIHSPYSGQPVKVREQDVGRAVRDEAGRVFYVLPRGGGEGHYASKTRAGGPEAEAAYDAMPRHEGQTMASAHDATGRPRRDAVRGKLVIAFLAVIVLGMLALWAFTVGPLGSVEWQSPPEPAAIPATPTEGDAQPPIDESKAPTTEPDDAPDLSP